LLLWRMNGAHVQSITTVPGTADDRDQLAAIDDFDGDGRADLLWRHVDGSATIWLMNGAQFTLQTVVDRSGDEMFSDGFDGIVPPAQPVFPGGWRVLGTGDSDGDNDGSSMLQLADDQGHSMVWQMQGPGIVQAASVAPDSGMPHPGINGWAMPLPRPEVTDAAGQVDINWTSVPGNPNYVLYLSPNPDPASSGYGLPVGGTDFSYADTDATYNSNLYFAVSASFHGVTTPPSKTAYRVGFTRTELPYWGAMSISDIDGNGCNDILGALSNCDGTFTLLSEADMGLGALRAPGTAMASTM
jgi:hypothetical protein